MLMADFHIHSTFSDGKLTIPEIVDLYGSHGFGAIAITDHICETNTVIGKAAHYLGRSLTSATFPLYTEILRSEAARAWDQYKMILFGGFELSKNSLSNQRSAHILAIGASDFISANDDILTQIRKIKSQGALAVAAHPVSTQKVEAQTYHLWDRREELRTEFDAWEVASGPYLFDEVLRSTLPKLANSDLHHPRQINAWKTVIYSERHPEAILEAVRCQQLSFKFFHVEEKENLYGIRTRMHLGLRSLAYGYRNLASS